VRDLLRLLVVLVLGVLEHLLGLAGAAQRVDRTLRRRDGLAGDARHGLRDGLGAGQAGARVGRALQLLDAPLELLGVSLGLTKVLLQALLVRRARGHRDVGLERSLELLLLAICLVQVLDDLCVSRWCRISHRSGLLGLLLA
jgi:hypothetical protein